MALGLMMACTPPVMREGPSENRNSQAWSTSDRCDALSLAAAVGTHLFVAVKALDGRIALNQADLGQPFAG